MSLISVDFISLSRQIEQLIIFREYIHDVAGQIGEVIHTIAYMNLYETEDELKILMRRLLDSADDIDDDINKLRKILDLYNECETEIEHTVDNLPLNMSTKSIADRAIIGKSDIWEHLVVNLKANSFGSHSVVNDDWLNDIMY